MKKWLFMIILNLFAVTVYSQTIKLEQSGSADDIKVINGDYILYFKKPDIIKAIGAIEKATGKDHAAIIEQINANKLSSTDLASKAAADKPFIDLIKSNLGSYLLLKGKAAISKSGKAVKTIIADESPMMVDLDGSSKVVIAFTEEDAETVVFVGNIQTALKAGD